jgi:hypothetical protein
MNPLTPEQRELIARQYNIPVDSLTDEQIRAAVSDIEASARESVIVPATANREKRTVQAVLATEEPCMMWDSTRWEPVDEILLMSGCNLKGVRKGKLPLLDAHQRDTTQRVLGSVTGLKVEGDKLTGTETFSALAEPVFQKTIEGHTDQRSLGYRVAAATYIEPGESATVEGRSLTAGSRALRVATAWTPVESSVVPVAADPACGTRAAVQPPTSPVPSAPAPAHQPQQRKVDAPVKLTAQQITAVRKAMNKPEATDDEVRAYAAEHPDVLIELGRAEGKASVTPPPANDEARAALIEIQRRDSVKNIARAYIEREGVRALADAAELNPAVTADSFRAQLLEHIAKQTPARPQVTKEEADNRRENAEASILVRAGHKLEGEAAKRAAVYRGFSLLDVARECVEASGFSTRGLGKLEIVQRAFHSTGDFPLILSSTANKALLNSFALAPATWERWCLRGSLSDFKSTPRVGMSESGVLASVPAGAEYPQYTITEKAENIQLANYGKIFAVTRQAIVNDDLSAFNRIPAQHARAWARTINQAAVKIILANAALSDGVTLYYATTHNNKSTITAATTVDTAAAVLRALVVLLRQQTDIDGTTRLGLQPRICLVTPTKEPYFAQAIFESGRASNNAPVDIVKLGLTMLVEPELENSDLTGYGTNVTYLFADPADAPVVEVAFLDGNAAPRLESEVDFDVDGMKFKVSGDVGAKAVDYRGTAMHVA